MQREESRTELGAIRIHKNVVASIASLATMEIEGTKSIGKNFRSGFLEMLGRKNISGIKVEIDKNEEIRVDIPLIIKYGYNIPDIADKVQENVRNALERMTNLSIKDININVRGVER